ncbi:hypothetical protein ACHAXT_011827 [Thalassiosira profunda]
MAVAARPSAGKRKEAALRRSENTAECLDLSGHSCDHRPEPPTSCLSVKTQRESLDGSFGHSSRSSGLNHSSRSSGLDHSSRSSVRFDTVEFREYQIALGDSPATVSGPAIGLSWAYHPEDTLVSDLDAYEECRTPRTKAELALPGDVREAMLLEAGYSRNEIRTAVAKARRARRRRDAPGPLDHIHNLAAWAAGSFKLRRGGGSGPPPRTSQHFPEHRDSLDLSKRRQFDALRRDSFGDLRKLCPGMPEEDDEGEEDDGMLRANQVKEFCDRELDRTLSVKDFCDRELERALAA